MLQFMEALLARRSDARLLVLSGQPGVIVPRLDARPALAAATLGGARALGFEHLVGSIEPGKQADLAIVDMAQLETQPLHHVVSQLVYATGRQQVTDTWIAGRAKLRDRRLVDMDEAALLANARQWRQRIAALGHAR